MSPKDVFDKLFWMCLTHQSDRRPGGLLKRLSKEERSALANLKSSDIQDRIK